MWIGRALVIIGSTFGSLLLSVFLFFLSSTPAGVSTAASITQATTINAGIDPQASAGISLQNASQDEVTLECRISDQFPASVRHWCTLITQQAESQGLSPDLIAALIWQESGGDPQAYSHSGAVGLMQVMPHNGIASTFMCKNGPCFANRPSIAELQDPAFNVSYGTNMLARLLSRTGDLREALRAYGPMDVGYRYADTVLKLTQQYGK